MYRATAILIILVASQQAAAEFYSWTENGTKHYSTHPRECIEAGIFQRLKPGCSPITPTAEQRQQFEKRQALRKEKEERQAAIERCEEMESRIEDLKHRIASNARSFSLDNFLDAGTIGRNLTAMSAAPMLHDALLEAHKEYDECVPESEIPERIAYRNRIRQELSSNAENFRQSQQQNKINQILNEVQDLNSPIRR